MIRRILNRLLNLAALIVAVIIIDPIINAFTQPQGAYA